MLGYFLFWGYVILLVIEFVECLVCYVFGDLNWVFFISGGIEVVEIVWKVVKQYFKFIGKLGKYKVILCLIVYYGIIQGVLVIIGLLLFKVLFELLMLGGFWVFNINFY